MRLWIEIWLNFWTFVLLQICNERDERSSRTLRNLLASAADDRQVKLWRMSETKASEVDKLIHFYERQQCILLSFSWKAWFGGTYIELWRSYHPRLGCYSHISKRVGVQTFRREGDRFFILASHRAQNLLAAGRHDCLQARTRTSYLDAMRVVCMIAAELREVWKSYRILTNRYKRIVLEFSPLLGFQPTQPKWRKYGCMQWCWRRQLRIDHLLVYECKGMANVDRASDQLSFWDATASPSLIAINDKF